MKRRFLLVGVCILGCIGMTACGMKQENVLSSKEEVKNTEDADDNVEEEDLAVEENTEKEQIDIEEEGIYEFSYNKGALRVNIPEGFVRDRSEKESSYLCFYNTSDEYIYIGDDWALVPFCQYVKPYMESGVWEDETSNVDRDETISTEMGDAHIVTVKDEEGLLFDFVELQQEQSNYYITYYGYADGIRKDIKEILEELLTPKKQEDITFVSYTEVDVESYEYALAELVTDTSGNTALEKKFGFNLPDGAQNVLDIYGSEYDGIEAVSGYYYTLKAASGGDYEISCFMLETKNGSSDAYTLLEYERYGKSMNQLVGFENIEKVGEVETVYGNVVLFSAADEIWNRDYALIHANNRDICIKISYLNEDETIMSRILDEMLNIN